MGGCALNVRTVAAVRRAILTGGMVLLPYSRNPGHRTAAARNRVTSCAPPRWRAAAWRDMVGARRSSGGLAEHARIAAVTRGRLCGTAANARHAHASRVSPRTARHHRAAIMARLAVAALAIHACAVPARLAVP